MIVTLELNQQVVKQFQEKAEAQDVPLEQLLVTILTAAADSQSGDTTIAMTPEAVMAQVRTLPPNPQAIIPAQGSLLEALQTGPEDPDFDLATWDQQWAQAEAEIKTITIQNDIQEGRH